MTIAVLYKTDCVAADANLIAAIGLTSGDPGGTGANELTGAGYGGRVAPTIGTAANGSTTLTGLFNVPAGTIAGWTGYKSDGSFYLGGLFPGGGATPSTATTASITIVLTQQG